MNIGNMVYQFKLKFNSIDSQIKKDFRLTEIDEFINDAITQFCLNLFDFRQDYISGFENNTKMIEAFSTLSYQFPDQPIITPTLLEEGTYRVKYSECAQTPWFITKVQANCSKDAYPVKKIDCKYKTLDTLNDRFSMPSYEWKRCPFRISNSAAGKSIYLYTETDFTISGVYVAYIKQPAVVFSGGYNHINGLYTTLTSPVDCDIDEKFHSEIVNIAVDTARKTLNK